MYGYSQDKDWLKKKVGVCAFFIQNESMYRCIKYVFNIFIIYKYEAQAFETKYSSLLRIEISGT